MRKILVLGNDTSLKGGIAISIKQILDYDWNSCGIEMNYIPTFHNKNKIYRLIFFMNAYAKAAFFLAFHKADVVHMHMSFKGSFYRKFALQKLCRLFHTPVVLHLHGSRFDDWYNNSNHFVKKQVIKMLRDVKKVIVLGTYWENFVKSICPDANTDVIYNAVRIPEKTVKWNASPFQVLFLGVLVQRKGIFELIEATKKLVYEKEMKNIKLVMAGTGAAERELKLKIQEYHLSEYVELTGWVSDGKKASLLERSQLFVLPSYGEGMPIALLEAMSYGMPVVATDVGDIPCTVMDGGNGYIVHPADVNALTDKMAMLISDKDLYEKMSLASRRYAEKQFSDTIYFNKLKMIYQGLS